MRTPPVRIWIDDREKLPWSFPGHEVVSTRLFAGDYSIDGLTDKVAIERKSRDDFLQTITWGRERFEAEMERLATYARALIIVECHQDDLLDGAYRPDVKPAAIVGSISSIHARWGISTMFFGSRTNAQWQARVWLSKCAKHLAHLKTEAA